MFSGFLVTEVSSLKIIKGARKGFFGVDGATKSSEGGPEEPWRVTGVSDMGGFLRSRL